MIFLNNDVSVVFEVSARACVSLNMSVMFDEKFILSISQRALRIKEHKYRLTHIDKDQQ